MRERSRLLRCFAVLVVLSGCAPEQLHQGYDGDGRFWKAHQAQPES